MLYKKLPDHFNFDIYEDYLCRYFMWKYKEVVMVISTLLPPLGLFCQYLLEVNRKQGP